MMSYSTGDDRENVPKYGAVEDPQDYDRIVTKTPILRRLTEHWRSVNGRFDMDSFERCFAILTVQLLLVVAIVAAVIFTPDVLFYVQSNQWVYWLSYIAFLITYIILMCCEGPRRNFPINIILLALLTLSIGYMTAMISAMYDTEIVLWAFGICVFCSLTIIIFASQTRHDFTGWLSVMFIVGMCVLIFGLIAIFISIFTDVSVLMLIYSTLMAIVFMVYLAIDVQLIVGGKRLEIDPEEYIFAVVFLFLDIIYIFWFLLEIFGFARNR